MAQLGQYNDMTLLKKEHMGWILDGGVWGNILLPNRYSPEDCKAEDTLKVFLYLDSEDRPIATTQRPRATVGQVASLQVKSVNQVGAFLDWGLAKDLLVPFSEQKRPMTEGDFHTVFLYLDNSNRIVATERLNRFIKDQAIQYQFNDKVKVMPYSPTDLGYKVVVDDKYWGVVHAADMRKPLTAGKKIEGYIKQPREDGKLDVSLKPLGYQKTGPLSDVILEKLEQAGGEVPLGDKSPADAIEDYFGMSKRVFKMTIGKLYKDKKIIIEKERILLVK
ncbi:MAG: GntR family transcriptional regulator [Pseudomonadales bacterium]|nr:GntR family transcriptional regulator [Pseudomonadales bacterium]